MIRRGLFKLEPEKLLETLSVDWTNGSACIGHWTRIKDTEDGEKLKKEIENVVYNMLGKFEDVLQYTEGEGYEYEEVFSYEGNFNFAIRLTPDTTAVSRIWVYEQ